MCKIPGCTKRYTDPSSLRKHVKTVHGPEAHVTKKQRGDLPSRPHPPKENGENEAGTKLSVRTAEEKLEANSTTRGVEDYLQVKSIKTENSMVRSSVNEAQNKLYTSMFLAQKNDCVWSLWMHNKMYVIWITRLVFCMPVICTPKYIIHCWLNIHSNVFVHQRLC